MTSIDLAEIHFYIDGELGPDEAAEAEERFEGDARQMALLDAYRRQRDVIAQALAALEEIRSESRPRSVLPEALAEVIMRRMAQSHAPRTGHPVLAETWRDL